MTADFTLLASGPYDNTLLIWRTGGKVVPFGLKKIVRPNVIVVRGWLGIHVNAVPVAVAILAARFPLPQAL